MIISSSFIFIPNQYLRVTHITIMKREIIGLHFPVGILRLTHVYKTYMTFTRRELDVKCLLG